MRYYNNSLASFTHNLNDILELYQWDNPWAQKSSCQKENGGYKVQKTVAGYNKSNLSIQIENKNLLTVRSTKEDEQDKVLYRLQVPTSTDTSKISAKCEDGILYIDLPDVKKPKPHAILIE